MSHQRWQWGVRSLGLHGQPFLLEKLNQIQNQDIPLTSTVGKRDQLKLLNTYMNENGEKGTPNTIKIHIVLIQKHNRIVRTQVATENKLLDKSKFNLLNPNVIQRIILSLSLTNPSKNTVCRHFWNCTVPRFIFSDTKSQSKTTHNGTSFIYSWK